MNDTCKNLGHCSVIVAEDDALLQMVFAIQLKTAGINFCGARNGADALQLVRSHHPKVLLMDICMPKLTGFEVVDALKKDADLADLKDMHLIIHTSRDLSAEEKQRLSFGRTQYFTKTQLGTELSEIVTMALSNSA